MPMDFFIDTQRVKLAEEMQYPVSVILLCPAFSFFCMIFLLCLVQYCVNHNIVSTRTIVFICTIFSCYWDAVLSCCTCEAPPLQLSQRAAVN